MPDDPHGVGKEIHRQVEREMHDREFDRVKKDRDSRIEELVDQKRRLLARIRELEDDNEQLRSKLDQLKAKSK